MGYVRPKRAKRPANRPKWPSHSFRRRVWATRFFEILDPGAFDEHFFNGLLTPHRPSLYWALYVCCHSAAIRRRMVFLVRATADFMAFSRNMGNCQALGCRHTNWF